MVFVRYIFTIGYIKRCFTAVIYCQYLAINVNIILADFSETNKNNLVSFTVCRGQFLSKMSFLVTFTSNSKSFVQLFPTNITKLALEMTCLWPTMWNWILFYLECSNFDFFIVKNLEFLESLKSGRRKS